MQTQQRRGRAPYPENEEEEIGFQKEPEPEDQDEGESEWTDEGEDEPPAGPAVLDEPFVQFNIKGPHAADERSQECLREVLRYDQHATASGNVVLDERRFTVWVPLAKADAWWERCTKAMAGMPRSGRWRLYRAPGSAVAASTIDGFVQIEKFGQGIIDDMEDEMGWSQNGLRELENGLRSQFAEEPPLLGTPLPTAYHSAASAPVAGSAAVPGVTGEPPLSDGSDSPFDNDWKFRTGGPPWDVSPADLAALHRPLPPSLVYPTTRGQRPAHPELDERRVL